MSFGFGPYTLPFTFQTVAAVNLPKNKTPFGIVSGEQTRSFQFESFWGYCFQTH